ncbi:MAG: hypothetical protein CL489_10000 [Acidobacteria bacterium]|nr:hypothetical protein [Acidobacteriota bacterium]
MWLRTITERPPRIIPQIHPLRILMHQIIIMQRHKIITLTLMHQIIITIRNKIITRILMHQIIITLP